jgi:hypothetical protein
MKKLVLAISILLTGVVHAQEAPKGFVSLFNGKDFTGWKLPEGDNGHWKIIDGVIDYDARSEAKESKDLWTARSYKDFEIMLDWRIKTAPFNNPRVPIVLPSGLHKLDENGKPITIVVPDADSGLFLRGSSKSQVNIWCWPTGSGEVYGYRMDENMPAEVRRGVTPITNADKNLGEWNTFHIIMKGDRLTVILNGIKVIDNAQLPGIPESGPIALQHHGSLKDGEWTSSPSLVQFRKIFIRELK